jgi:hypothetical protein
MRISPPQITAPRILAALGSLLILAVLGMIWQYWKGAYLECLRGERNECVYIRDTPFNTTVRAFPLANLKSVETKRYGRRVSTLILLLNNERLEFTQYPCSSSYLADDLRAFLRDTSRYEVALAVDCRPEIIPQAAMFTVIALTLLGGAFIWHMMEKPKKRRT